MTDVLALATPSNITCHTPASIREDVVSGDNQSESLSSQIAGIDSEDLLHEFPQLTATKIPDVLDKPDQARTDAHSVKLAMEPSSRDMASFASRVRCNLQISQYIS